MSTGGYNIAERRIRGVERAIEGDMAMGNFYQIDHVWIHTDIADSFGLKDGDRTVMIFQVLLPIMIRIAENRSFLCEVKTNDGESVPINLEVDSCTLQCFDINRLLRNFEGGVGVIGFNRLINAYVTIHPLLAFVAIKYARKSFGKIYAEMNVLDGSTVMRGVPFKVDCPFKVIVSKEEPRTVCQPINGFKTTTVDANGWVIGYRSAEEVASIPYPYHSS